MLNEKQELFCREYITDLNAKQAAIRAGYSPKTAESQGARLLSHAKVADRVQELMDKRANKLDITAERVLSELARMSFYDPAQLVGIPLEKPEDIAQLPEEVRRCITGWGYDRLGNFTIKLANKQGCLELLGRHLKLFTDRIIVEEKLDLATKMAEARARVKARRGNQ